MTKPTVNNEWLETVPTHIHPHMESLERLANLALDNKSAYHSIRISNDRIKSAGNDGGRILGWSITRTTQLGWEYESVVMDGNGTMMVLFKNPYVFS